MAQRQSTPVTLVLVAVAVGLLGCGSSRSSSKESDFYTPPDPLPSSVPGSLIRSEPIEPFAEGTRAWRVLYVSTALDGSPIAVSGMVAAPGRTAADAPYDVVTWAHGLTGVVDRCAASRGFRFGNDFHEVVPALLQAGYVAVGTDYEGLGTPGVHPYLVGVSEGRGVLDIVKAAQELLDLPVSDRFAVWGLSQGGHAALFAGEIAPSYAPDLELVGVVSAAPGSEFPAIIEFGQVVPAIRSVLWQLAVSFEAVYPELAMEDIFDSDTVDTIDRLLDEEACIVEFESAGLASEKATFAVSPLDIPAWEARITENSPGQVPTDAPILLLQSRADQSVPIQLTDVFFSRLCGIGAEVEYRVFDGLTHNDTTRMNIPLMLSWTEARFASEPAIRTCP
ncbi:MAG: lipase family protein [Polyangiales bacterium]